MKLVQLLSGAAAVALIAGAAQAQDVSVDVGGDLIGQTVMSERTGALAGDLVLDFALDGAFAAMGAGGSVQVDVTLTNATFSGIVPANAWTAAADTDCDFGAPTLGGGAGGTTVRFTNVNQINLCDAALGAAGSPDDGTLTLPLSVTNVGDDVSVTVTFTPTADAGGYTGDTESLDILTFAQAYNFTIAAGAAGAGLFDAVGDDLLGSGTIGTIDLAALPAGIRSDLATPLADVQTAASAGEIAVTFPSGATGIGTVDYEADSGTVNCVQGAAPNDNVFTCPASGANLDALIGGQDTIVIDDDADALTSITVQTPTIAMSFTDVASFDVADVAAANARELDLDDGLATETFPGNNSFPWVSVRTDGGGTVSAFRLTGLASDLSATGEEVQVRATRSNGALGSTDWVAVTPATVSASADGATWTATFQSDEIGTALGVAGNVNADLEFRVRCNDTDCNDGANANLEILRVLSRGGIVTGTGFDG